MAVVETTGLLRDHHGRGKRLWSQPEVSWQPESPWHTPFSSAVWAIQIQGERRVVDGHWDWCNYKSLPILPPSIIPILPPSIIWWDILKSMVGHHGHPWTPGFRGLVVRVYFVEACHLQRAGWPRHSRDQWLHSWEIHTWTQGRQDQLVKNSWITMNYQELRPTNELPWIKTH